MIALLAFPAVAAYPPPWYETTDHVLTVPDRTAAGWVTTVKASAKRKKVQVHWAEPGSAAREPLGEGKPHDEVGWAGLVAVWMALEGPLEAGAEADLVLVDAEGPHPVTVWLEEGAVVVSAGPSIALPPEGRSVADIVAAHGLAGADESQAAFEPRVRGVIDEVLGLLTDREKVALADVTLLRVPSKGPSTKGRWVNSAELRTETDRGVMAVFDDLLRPVGRFVGSVERPYHTAYAIFVHEVAHAIDTAPLRALARDFNARVDALNADTRAYNAEVEALRSLRSPPADRVAANRAQEKDIVARQAGIEEDRARIAGFTPVSEGFRKRFAGFTPYGDTADQEAFAEAFALHHLDPAALRRISPEAADWFAAGGHLAGFGEAGL
ncbi:MAG: hypothetical protein H6737_12100 [Alphaproteobacteria bacterium]|nr:hypothetical protein [Alphaproteobacteria bacterium]